MESEKLPNPTRLVDEIEHKDVTKIKTIGRGSFGKVDKCWWEVGGKEVAVKELLYEKDVEMFKNEIIALCLFDHENIVKLFAYCTTPLCLVMELADGSLWDEIHDPTREIELETRLKWALQAAQGLSYLHSRDPKIIHRDFKSQNALLFPDSIVKICDFGLAREVAPQMTTNAGTPHWMAPEVSQGWSSATVYTEKVDVYSWGIFLWELVTREKPFEEADNSELVRWAVSRGTRPPINHPALSSCTHQIPHFISRCWSQNENLRPSMDAVVTEIRLLINNLNSPQDTPYFLPRTENGIQLASPLNRAQVMETLKCQQERLCSHVEFENEFAAHLLSFGGLSWKEVKYYRKYLQNKNKIEKVKHLLTIVIKKEAVLPCIIALEESENTTCIAILRQLCSESNKTRA